MAIDQDFAQYCCELLSSVGPCVPRRMFGGFGISVDGLTIAIIANLGQGDKLWLKGDEATRSQYAAAGCTMFIYDAKGAPRSMNYFCAPQEGMDSADAMRPWAALALECALRAQAAKRKPTSKPSTNTLTQASTTRQDSATPSKLSHTVLARARETAIKMAASKSLPTPKPAKPATKRATAPAPKTAAKRKSAKGANTAAQ
jgi:DNA transformation protein and related proteins